MTLFPRISIIVVTHNHEKYIQKCLDSIARQTLSPWKITIHDDCSTDNTSSIVDQFAREYHDKVQVIRPEKNTGNLNRGQFIWGMADGDYCSLIEGDDYWAENKLECEFLALANMPSAKAAYSNVAQTDEAGNVVQVWNNPNKRPMPSGNLFYNVASRTVFSDSGNCFRNYLIHTPSLKACGWLPDTNLPHLRDYDKHLTLSNTFEFAASTEENPTVYYRRHAKGFSQDSSNIRIASRLIYEKHRDEINKLPLLQKIHACLYQETSISSNLFHDSALAQNTYYMPADIYNRYIKIVSDNIDKISESTLELYLVFFRQLATLAIKTNLLENDTHSALSVFFAHEEHEKTKNSGWLRLTQAEATVLQDAMKTYQGYK